MTSSNPLSTHLEDLRSRNPQSPPGEHGYNGYPTPARYSGSFLNPNPRSSRSDGRGSLTRRMTADANLFNAFSSITSQPGFAWEGQDMNASTLYKVQALEKKRQELEKTREQRRRFDAELEKFNRQQAQEERELEQMASDLQGVNISSGRQSEPTTPPEYRDSLPAMYNRRNRYSSSQVVSPPVSNNRLSRSSSQMTSPPTDAGQSQQGGSDSDKLPSKSVPSSRRSSSDRFSSYLAEMNSVVPPRTTPRSNRYSMPVQRTKRESVPEFTNGGLGHINTTKFLFEDEDEVGQKEAAPMADVKDYLHMNTTDDNFPILVRNNMQPNRLSTSSAALDLAQSPNQEPGDGWPPAMPSRNRLSQQGLPQNFFDQSLSNKVDVGSPSASSQQSLTNIVESPSGGRKSNRHSLETSLTSLNRNNVFTQPQAGPSNSSRPALANFQSSYSTNDIPTLKSHQDVGASGHRPTPSTSQVNQHFHSHNASLGRIPPPSSGNRSSRDASTLESHREEPVIAFNAPAPDVLAASAALVANVPVASSMDASATLLSSPALQQYASPAYYGGYGMHLLNMGLSPMQVANTTALNAQMNMYPVQHAAYGGFPGFVQPGRAQDSQARVIQQRRMQNAEEIARFSNAKIEQYRGEIYGLCKDQHGCRYLQKQLETRNAETVHLIFLETQNHVVELMTDPFGNYLCQKLLEHSNDAQRTVLVDNAAPEMVKIALNQHGTRALQKMIEYISTPEQTQTIIHALKDKVVELIQDLNGNHVIQKCLNRLSTDDAQFIFEAVGANCVVVGTHRHGCCVLQRCVDHASPAQKAALVHSMTQNASALVQDPFGNYVLQYIVDLNEPSFTHPLCYAFKGNIPMLSKQKFSSNVIEKCLRHADTTVGGVLVEEMLNINELEKMLRDSYANYVVQTALDFADPMVRAKLVDAIRPILPSIRGTPYGRRIQTKILSQSGETPSEPLASNRADGTNGFSPRPQGFHGAPTAATSFSPTPVDKSLNPVNGNAAASSSNGLGKSLNDPYGTGAVVSPTQQQFNRMPPNNSFGGFF